MWQFHHMKLLIENNSCLLDNLVNKYILVINQIKVFTERQILKLIYACLQPSGVAATMWQYHQKNIVINCKQ